MYAVPSNSMQYVFFLLLTTLFFYKVPHRLQIYFLLVVSYCFYMMWNPYYALVLIILTLISFIGGLIVEKSGSKTRKGVCGLAIFVNIGTLVFFKYTGFLMENLKTILGRLGVSFPENIYTIFVPVGISFYVFQSVGYLIDVYRHKISAERNVINYALFIAFFPQIVSGPINRAGTLLPQLKTLHRKPNPTQLCEGLKLIFTGYLQKIVFADMFTIYIDAVYKDLKTWGGVTVLAAGILYSFQIYCDFAGYSNIAIGSARLLGIEIQENFNAPYRAVSIRDFWNRWHISLSTWLRDYIYFPLGGGRCSFLRKNLNIFIVFLVSGIWHGAAWNYIIWGLLHGVARVVENILNIVQKRKLSKAVSRASTFAVVTVAWVFFRSPNIQTAMLFFQRLFQEWSFTDFAAEYTEILKGTLMASPTLNIFYLGVIALGGVFLWVLDRFEDRYYASNGINALFVAIPKRIRGAVYLLGGSLIIFCYLIQNGIFGQIGQFIYFQF